ncbi:YgjV family protein [Desulfobaculum sp.]
MTPYTLSQILVGIAIITDILSFQFKDRRRIVFCLFLSGILISSHFFLLGHSTAGLLMLIATTRYLTSVYTTSRRAMGFFLSLSTIAAAWTYEGLLSIISYLGSAFQTAGAFAQHDKRLRQLMIIGTLFWLLHNTLAQSPTAVLMEALFLVSNIVGYYRHYKRQDIPTYQQTRQ